MTHPGSPEHPADGTASGDAAAEPGGAGPRDRAYSGVGVAASRSTNVGRRKSVHDRTSVAPGLRRAVSVGYLLRAAWTTIVAGALIRTAATGPIVDPLGSPWLQVAIVLAALDLVVYLGILAAERLRPALGTGWLETPLVTIILAVATLGPGSINTTSPGATIFMTVAGRVDRLHPGRAPGDPALAPRHRPPPLPPEA